MNSKIVLATHLSLKAIIYSLLPIVFFLIVTSNSPILFGIRSFVVQTGSMEPKIPVGSIIFSIPQDSYQLGDIILFKDFESRVVAHRINQSIIKSGQISYQTKGDANNGPDSNLISETKVMGREFFLIPSVGKISAFIKTIPGFLAILGIPTLLFIAFELKNIKEELEKEIKKKVTEEIGASV